MPEYSTIAVTTACDDISRRVISTQAELDAIVKSVDPASYKVQQLLALSGSLTQLKGSVKHLGETISAAVAVSHSIQDILTESVDPCDHASAIVEKQIRSLELGFDIETLNVNMVTHFAQHATCNAQLFTLVAVLLQVPEPDAQTARLVTVRGQSILNEAVAASLQVRNSSDAQLSMSSPQSNTPESLPPPDYSPVTRTNNGAARARKEAPSGFFSSLTHSFKAAASTLMPKPDPLSVAMCQSAKVGNVAHMEGLLAQGVKINGQDEDGYTPLICAARADQKEAVRFLLAAGADKAAKDSHSGKRKSALFHAAECGHLAMVEALLDAGADMRERSWSGQPQFVEVANGPRLDVIGLFLERGAEANTVSITGRTIFIHAIQAGSIEHVRLLQRYGGDINARDITGQPALQLALGQKRLDIVDFLLSCGADANTSDITGNSILHQAIDRKDFDLARILLARGANPNVAGPLGKTVLAKLVENSTADDDTEADLARIVLEKGADPNLCDSWGERLMCHVVDKGNTSLLRAFLDFRGDPNLMFRREETLFLHAMSKGHFDHALMLLKAGADPNKANVHGKTPLVEALAMNQPRLVRELLDRNADINIAGAIRPAAFARLMRDREMVDMLVAKGAEGPPRERETPSSPNAMPSVAPAGPDHEEEDAPPSYTPK